MASGAAVIKYEGKRGVVWYAKYRDASGRQVKERLGRVDEGWTRRKAERELRHRLTDVERTGWRKPEPVTFACFAEDWLATYPDTKGLKRSTRVGYRSNLDAHLLPALGHLRLDKIGVGHVESYVAEQRRRGYSGRTVNRDLNLLNLIFAAALRRGLVRANPVPLVDRPKQARRKWRILSPGEIARVERAFAELIAEADGAERRWRETCRVAFLTIVGAGLRKGELLGLKWRDVDLADPEGALLRVRETWIEGAADTPKSESGERTIALDPVLAEELWQHRRRSAFQGNDERVLGHPERGTPLPAKRYAATFRLALARAGLDPAMRPFHDGRHTAITNDAASGNAPLAIMKRAGHSDFKTTQGYIDLAGETFRAEAERLGARLWGQSGTKKRYQDADALSGETTELLDSREVLSGP